MPYAATSALTPGMPVEVHLRTGERSPLSYLAKPLTDYFSRSLREELMAARLRLADTGGDQFIDPVHNSLICI